MWRTFHWTSKWSDCLPRTSALQLLFPAIKSELRHPTENLVLKVLLPQSFSLLTARRKTIKILPNVFCVIDYPQIFQGASPFLIRKEHIFSTAYHAIQGGYGTVLQQSSSKDKIPPAGVFPAGVCSGTSLILLPSSAKQKASSRSQKRSVSSCAW